MALSRITEAVASFTDLTIADDLTLSDDLLMASDAAKISFGADADVSFTHVADTGLLLNSTSVIQFNDASQNIGAPSATVLDINATDEIELNATLIDVNGNLDISGTALVTGVLTTTAATVFNGGFASNADSTMGTDKKIQFRDTGLTINSSADGQLDIVADTEVQIAATTIDINGNVEISGTLAQVGVSTSTAKDIFNAGMSLKNGATSAGFAEFFEDSDNGTNKVTLIGPASTADVTVVLPATAGTLALTSEVATTESIQDVVGAMFSSNTETNITVTYEDSDGTIDLVVDAAQPNVTSLGTLTTLTVDNIIINGSNIGHTSDTDAIAIASNGQLTLTQTLIGTALDISGDIDVDGTTNLDVVDIDGAVDMASTLQVDGAITGSSTIQGTTITATTAFVPDASDGAALGTSSLEFSDLFLADGAVISFGDDQEITLTHVADDGLILKHVGTADGKEPSFSFHAGDNDIAANDVLGSIFFKAPDEGAGTDAILVAAGIEAVSEGDFSASNNATKLSFLTGASEAAAEKMSLSSGGNLTVSGNLGVGGTAVANTDTDTSNTGNVTLDFGANQNFVLTLTGNTTLANPSTEQVGQSGFIVCIQDGTGSRTLSLGTDYETAGGAGITLTSTASATDIIPYVVAAAGRILLGAPQLAFS